MYAVEIVVDQSFARQTTGPYYWLESPRLDEAAADNIFQGHTPRLAILKLAGLFNSLFIRFLITSMIFLSDPPATFVSSYWDHDKIRAQKCRETCAFHIATALLVHERDNMPLCRLLAVARQKAPYLRRIGYSHRSMTSDIFELHLFPP